LKHSCWFSWSFIYARFQVYFNSAIAVPVAIIGTFANIWFLDQHADVICHDSAIGIVVDAIVVVEAVHAKLDEGLSQPKLLFLQ
jgi:multidrug efflux pump subunit AcrB